MLIILDRRQPPLTIAQGTPVNNYRIYNTYTSSTSGPDLVIRGVDSINAFTRSRIHAEALARQSFPPTPIAETK